LGGRARAFEFASEGATGGSEARTPARQRPKPLAPLASEDEIALHRAFVTSLGETAIWRRYG
ncbi:MAG: DNA polymerase III subunit epsilon, partial [Pseudomonadota bacterium]